MKKMVTSSLSMNHKKETGPRLCEAGAPLSCLRQLDCCGLATRPETQLRVELLLSLTSKTRQQALSPL